MRSILDYPNSLLKRKEKLGILYNGKFIYIYKWFKINNVAIVTI